MSAREEWEIVLDHTDVAVRLENDWHGNYAAHTLARLTGVGIAQGPWRGTPAAALRAIGINANPQLEPHNCADEIIALRAERDALRKDVARLDWLESRKSYSISNLGGMTCAHLWVTDGEDVRVTKTVTKPTIREAIDAAMEAKV